KQPIAVMVMGRPGAGKDTQAELVAKHVNLMRISTSDVLVAYMDEHAGEPEVQKERVLFDRGDLMSPSFVLGIVQERVRELAAGNFKGKRGIIFSGSPRTMFEVEGLYPVLEEIFGQENIFAFYLEIPAEEGIARIQKRNARELDRGEEKLRIRMREYTERTEPVLRYLEGRGVLHRVDGTGTIEEIAGRIVEELDQ
ncbi:MAG: nucleoside monophosphate kinase, partial [Candidatus Spechtbacterales bacterium]